MLRILGSAACGTEMIHLVGPGGAGKSTVGPILAGQLGLLFRDLDVGFTERFGNIDVFIAEHGYPAYARANVSVYRSVVRDDPDGVLALSSGFMTYALAVHPEYGSIRHDISHSPTTVVLLPSLDFEICVAETVRRQAARPISQRSAEREEAVDV